MAAHGGVFALYYDHINNSRQQATEANGHATGHATGSTGSTKPGQGLLTEYVPGFEVQWAKLSADANGVALPHDHVHWQALQQAPPAGAFSDAIHAQYWAVGRIKVKKGQAGTYAINTPALHTFEMVRFDATNGTIREHIGPLNGSTYIAAYSSSSESVLQ